MKKIIYILIGTLFFVSQVSAQVPVPADPQQEPVLLVGSTVHVGNGTVIENAAVGFSKGKITVVADESKMQADRTGFKVIDVTGQHIYPGFILPNSQLGLVEVSSVRAMRDESETGELNPNVRSVVAYNTDSEMPPTMRYNGILLAEVAPTGGRISGSSSVMEMDGWNWEDAALSIDVAIHLNWPSKMRRRFDFATFSVSENPNPDYEKEINELDKHFKDAWSYSQNESTNKNLKMESMAGLFAGSKVLMIHAAEAGEIIEAVNFAKEKKVQRIAVIADQEVIFVADFLAEHEIPVVLPPVHDLPARSDYDIVLPYKLPHMLTEAGVQVSLSHSGMLANARNLPFYAGTAAAYGMDKEEALKTITSNTAKLLGIDDRVGTIEVGKDATLFVSSGDALDIRSNDVTHAFIRGKTIRLKNKQQELYERYSKKFGHIK